MVAGMVFSSSIGGAVALTLSLTAGQDVTSIAMNYLVCAWLGFMLFASTQSKLFGE